MCQHLQCSSYHAGVGGYKGHKTQSWSQVAYSLIGKIHLNYEKIEAFSLCYGINFPLYNVSFTLSKTHLEKFFS